MTNWIDSAKSDFGIELSAKQRAQFQIYLDELLEWNQKFNLTAIRDVEGIEIKHFLDSLSVVQALPKGGKPNAMIDIGTGAGFPGIPLKILYPEAKLTLVESIKKKAGFCEQLAEKLELSDVIVSTARAEEIGQDKLHRAQYDLVLARAVAKMSILVEFLLPLATLGGLVVMQKGSSAKEEAEESKNAIRLMGGKMLDLFQINLPGLEDERYMVVLEKIKATPSEFPRRVGIPTKSPIKN